MEWIKASIETTAFGAEVVTGVLLECGVVGVEIIDPAERVRFLRENTAAWDYAEEGLLSSEGDGTQVVFYVTADAAGEKILDEVRAGLRGLDFFEPDALGSPELHTHAANDETWLHEWKKFFKVLRIGRVVIVPEWEAPPAPRADDVIFTIDPGSAFGTGQHQTTRLCIEAMQEFFPAPQVLDIGCGSGILSIISLLLGASEVFACDIDPAGAIASTKNNARLNPIDPSRLKIRAGDALSDDTLRTEIREKKYHAVLANIVADVLIPLAPLVREVLYDGGAFIASGIIDNRAEEVFSAFRACGFEIVREYAADGWHAVVCR